MNRKRLVCGNTLVPYNSSEWIIHYPICFLQIEQPTFYWRRVGCYFLSLSINNTTNVNNAMRKRPPCKSNESSLKLSPPFIREVIMEQPP